MGDRARQPAPQGRPAPLPASLRPKMADTSTPAYKRAARQYVGTMIALPILLVTSYVLFDRLALGTERKHLVPPKAQPDSPTADSNATKT